MSITPRRCPPPPIEVTVGTELPSLHVRITRETLVRYAGASGDFNPIHFSDHFATALGLPGVLAHGMLTMGIALRIVTDWVGDPARVCSWYARFSKPLLVPDTEDGAELIVSGIVTAVTAVAEPDAEFDAEPHTAGERVATVTVEAIAGGERVLRGAVAEVTLPAPADADA